MQSAINWPKTFLPGTTDNFVTNEVIVKDITASQIWPLLSDISEWSSYYDNVSQITPPSSGSSLHKGDIFHFSTFGFPVLESKVEESDAPSTGKPGRLAWSAKLEGDADHHVEVYHAWLVEDLEGPPRVRILTQESQKGKPVVEMAEAKPNRMLLGHQDWCEGLIRAASGKEGKADKTNLGSV